MLKKRMLKSYFKIMLKTFLKKTSKEEKFWSWFTENANLFFHFENNQNVLFERLKNKLDKIDTNFVFEFSNILEDGKREFVISADGIKESFPSVTKLVKQAPNFNKWKIIAFRQPRKKINLINYEGLKINFKNVFFKYRKNNGEIDLELHIKEFYESAEWTSAVFILLDNILGEYHTEMTLGFIDKKKLDKNEKDDLFPIYELPQIIQEYHLEQNN
jgi:hypothetical protein